MDQVLTVIDECSVLCSRAHPTPFRSCQVSELSAFTWDQYIQEMERKSPTLLRLLKKVACHSDHRNEQKKADRHTPGICMCVAVLLKERNREIVGVQTHILSSVGVNCPHLGGQYRISLPCPAVPLY